MGDKVTRGGSDELDGEGRKRASHQALLARSGRSAWSLAAHRGSCTALTFGGGKKVESVICARAIFLQAARVSEVAWVGEIDVPSGRMGK